MFESYGIDRKSLISLHKVSISIIFILLFIRCNDIVFYINMIIALLSNLIAMKFTKKNMIFVEAFDAAKHNDIVSMNALIDEGVNLNIKNMDNLNLLQLAILLEYKDMVELLINKVPSLIDMDNNETIKYVVNNLNKDIYWESLLYIVSSSKIGKR